MGFNNQIRGIATCMVLMARTNFSSDNPDEYVNCILSEDLRMVQIIGKSISFIFSDTCKTTCLHSEPKVVVTVYGMGVKGQLSRKILKCLLDAGVDYSGVYMSDTAFSVLIKVNDRSRAVDAISERFEFII